MSERLRDVRVEISTATSEHSTYRVYSLGGYDSLADLISAVREALKAIEGSL